MILTAALMIAGATLTLLLSGVRFLSAFGPSMAVAVIVSALVAMTLVPAALAIFGRALLWPRGLGGQSSAGGGRPGGDPGRGARGPRSPDRRRRQAARADRAPLRPRPARRPRAGLRHLELGNPVMRGLPETSEPRQGYDAASAGIGPGVLGPTMLVLEEPGIAKREAELASFQAELEASSRASRGARTRRSAGPFARGGDARAERQRGPLRPGARRRSRRRRRDRRLTRARRRPAGDARAQRPSERAKPGSPATRRSPPN